MLQHLPLLRRQLAPSSAARLPSIACTAAGADVGLLSSPELWVVGTTALLCTIFATFEKGVELAEESVPKYVRPSIEAILGEMATLGFIGLLVQTDVLGLQKGLIAELSERFLGEAELCFEIFEYVHQFLFKTAIAYFLASGLQITAVVRRLEARFAEVDYDGDGLLTPAELSGAVDEGDIDAEQSTPLGEALLACARANVDVSDADVAAYRERGGMTTDDLRAIAAERIEELVELEPLTIFMLTTLFATGGLAVDLQRDGGLDAFVAGDYVGNAPASVVIMSALVGLSYAGFRPGVVGLGRRLLGQRFVLTAIKVLNFSAAFFLLLALDLVPAEASALLAGAPSQAAVTESAVVALSLGASIAVLVRLDEILFQFIGCAGRARLEACGRGAASET